MRGESRLVLIACYLAILANGVNSTAIMAALPRMSQELRLGPSMVEWVVNAYLLAAAAFIALGGRAADGFGPRRSSAVGITLFALASLFIALAPGGAVVVAARALQGLGAAFMVAGTLAAVSEAVPAAGRPGAISTWTGCLMLGFSLGPLIGGFITHYAGWRFNFWLNLLAMLPAAAALLLQLEPGGRQRDPLDWRGLLLLVAFMVLLILGLHALPRVAAAPWDAILPLALAAAAFAVLYRTERHRDRPLLDFALFTNRTFALAALIAFLIMFDIMALLLYYNLFAQAPSGLAMTPRVAGLSLLPLSVALFGFARAAPRLGATIGVPRMMAGGAALLVLGAAIVWTMVLGAGRPVLLLGLFACGAGIALPFASSQHVGLAALRPDRAGQGAGVISASSFLGGTVGVTGGGIVSGFAGFPGVLLLVALAALASVALSLRIEEKPRS